MTYKATYLSDSQLKIAGFVELLPRETLRSGDIKRQIWALNDVFELLKGLKNPDAGFPALSTDMFIGRFLKGWIVSVSRKENSKAEFKWLKRHDDVWVLSFRKPSPGWRIFGRFARKNVFVAMVYFEREELSDMVTYNKKASEIPSLWDAKFPGVAPYTASTSEDYLGSMVKEDV